MVIIWYWIQNLCASIMLLVRLKWVNEPDSKCLKFCLVLLENYFDHSAIVKIQYLKLIRGRIFGWIIKTSRHVSGWKLKFLLTLLYHLIWLYDASNVWVLLMIWRRHLNEVEPTASGSQSDCICVSRTFWNFIRCCDNCYIWKCESVYWLVQISLYYYKIGDYLVINAIDVQLNVDVIVCSPEELHSRSSGFDLLFALLFRTDDAA